MGELNHVLLVCGSGTSCCRPDSRRPSPHHGEYTRAFPSMNPAQYRRCSRQHCSILLLDAEAARLFHRCLALFCDVGVRQEKQPKFMCKPSRRASQLEPLQGIITSTKGQIPTYSVKLPQFQLLTKRMPQESSRGTATTSDTALIILRYLQHNSSCNTVAPLSSSSYTCGRSLEGLIWTLGFTRSWPCNPPLLASLEVIPQGFLRSADPR